MELLLFIINNIIYSEYYILLRVDARDNKNEQNEQGIRRERWRPWLVGSVSAALRQSRGPSLFIIIKSCDCSLVTICKKIVFIRFAMISTSRRFFAQGFAVCKFTCLT